MDFTFLKKGGAFFKFLTGYSTFLKKSTRIRRVVEAAEKRKS
jgi:uncharacterized membrane protein